jgi:hypothetical protein
MKSIDLSVYSWRSHPTGVYICGQLFLISYVMQLHFLKGITPLLGGEVISPSSGKKGVKLNNMN